MRGGEGTSSSRDSKSTPLEVDSSELRGLTYRCLDGCALCCLCQPELLPEEQKEFLADPGLRSFVTDKHISPEVRGSALRLQGAHGACAMLRSRRCTHYERRPHYCRAFPISVFLGWRVQLNANLSCRGVRLKGDGLEQLGKDVIDRLGISRVREGLASSSNVFFEFESNSRDARTYQSASSVREAAHALSDDMADLLGLSRVLTFASGGKTRPNSDASDLARRARSSEAETDVYELGAIIGTELFDLEDLSYLPVYVDDSLNWTIFRLEGRTIVGYRLEEDGTTHELLRTDPSEVELLRMTEDGRKAFLEYLAITNARDCFLGHAAHLSDIDGYTHNFGQVYLGATAETALDLWWRSSFLAGISRRGLLDQKAIHDGITFIDMDVLDQPTIGAFL